MISNVFLKLYFLGTLWGYVFGLTLGVPNFRSGISKRASMEDFGDIEKLLRECKSGFKSSTIKADYMTVSDLLYYSQIVTHNLADQIGFRLLATDLKYV